MSQPAADLLAPDTYELAYLQPMDFYYVDRDYVVSTIPEELNNCLWIKTANDDKNNSSADYIKFKLDARAIVYVAYDHRANSLPEWLSSQFTATALSITTSDKTTLDLYSKNFDPGSISLGGNMAVGAAGTKSNYVVLINFEPSLVQKTKNVETFLLQQNYPNPFNSSTTCAFSIPVNKGRQKVELVIYDIQGKRVRTLINNDTEAGTHQVKWNGTADNGNPVTSGIYYCQFKCGGFKDVKKMILLR